MPTPTQYAALVDLQKYDVLATSPNGPGPVFRDDILTNDAVNLDTTQAVVLVEIDPAGTVTVKADQWYSKHGVCELSVNHVSPTVAVMMWVAAVRYAEDTNAVEA